MKYLFIVLLILSVSVSAHESVSDAREPETKEEQEAFEEWNEEEEEAREMAERERWILEERARGYEPTSKRYNQVMPEHSEPVQ